MAGMREGAGKAGCVLKQKDGAGWRFEEKSSRSSPEGKLPVNFAHDNPGHQRVSKTGPAGGGGRGADDDCAAGDCARGGGGFGCAIGALSWGPGGGAGGIFCLLCSSV